MKLKSILLTLMLLPAMNLFSQNEGLNLILKPGSAVTRLADGFSFTEGPAPDHNGDVYFTDQPNDRILVWRSTGVLETFMQPSGRSNGMFFDSKGNLWSCADEKNELWLIAPDKSTKVILRDYEGRLFNGPNDVCVSSEGAVYFTDPFYRRSWWEHTAMPQEKQCVYYLSPDHKTLKRVAEDLLQPNGIVGTPDGKMLYIADIKDNKTWSYKILADGSLGEKKLFCNMGSDGMTIDKKGNIYLTGKGVTVFDKAGNQLGTIQVPENWTANVCFGGKARKMLFITASKGLYSVETRIRGAY